MQNQQQQEGFDLSGKMNILIGIVQIIGKMPQVFLRRSGTWGERYCGFQFPLSIVFAFFFGPFFFRTADPRPMMWLIASAVVLLTIHRIAGIWRRKRGYMQHSLYTGRSWIPGNEAFVKKTLEPLLVVFIGLVLVGYSAPLSTYLIVSGICCGMAAVWQCDADEARLRQARDAKFDAEWMMSRQ